MLRHTDVQGYSLGEEKSRINTADELQATPE